MQKAKMATHFRIYKELTRIIPWRTSHGTMEDDLKSKQEQVSDGTVIVSQLKNIGSKLWQGIFQHPVPRFYQSSAAGK